MGPILRRPGFLLLAAAATLVAACVMGKRQSTARNDWLQILGPVVPHETFPADCQLCHVAKDWQTLRPDFEYDHAAETGVPLEGAHDQAKCLRCHNDRGSVAVFTARGCGGCHEDVHLGELGTNCTECHRQETWVPVGQIAMHNRTRFPLVGVHAATSCRRCHIGAELGRFTPTDVECVTCHRDDLQRANNPDHVAANWIDRCDRCHLPTDWLEEEVD